MIQEQHDTRTTGTTSAAPVSVRSRTPSAGPTSPAVRRHPSSAPAYHPDGSAWLSDRKWSSLFLESGAASFEYW